MKHLLHIDTSGDIGYVALAADGQIICSEQNNETRNHASTINLMIERVLAGSQVSFKDLAGVVVCAGPGSYTGLRIGMATAKGLCYALDIPLFLDNKLTLLAFQAYKKFGSKFAHYIAILPARENEYFLSIHDNNFTNTYDANHIMGSELDSLLSGKENMCIISNQLPPLTAEKYAENLYVAHETEIDKVIWGFYSFEQYKCNKTVNLSTSEPFYLKQVYTHK